MVDIDIIEESIDESILLVCFDAGFVTVLNVKTQGKGRGVGSVLKESQIVSLLCEWRLSRHVLPKGPSAVKLGSAAVMGIEREREHELHW